MTISLSKNRMIRAIHFIYGRYREEGCAYRAAALAYTTLLSLVPLVIVMVSLLSLIPEFREIGGNIESLIVRNFVPSAADSVIEYIDLFVSHVTSLSIINILFLGVVSILLMYNINRAFIAIWHTEQHFQFSLHFLIYFIVLLLSPFLLSLIMLFIAFLSQLTVVNSLIRLPYVHQSLFLILPYVITFVTFTLLNWVLPSVRVKLLHAAIGGLVTTVLFELAKLAFTLYVSLFPTYRLLYGVLSIIPIFLVWLYVSWTIILLGAIVSHAVARGMSTTQSKA